MLSAVGQDGITAKAIGMGAEYYIIKPFEIDLLVRRIREVTRNKVIDRPQYITKEIMNEALKENLNI